MKRAVSVLLIFAAIGAAAGAYYIRRNGAEITVNTLPITRGDVIDTVGSTGTLQAVTTVQVGSQVSGNISWLGADFNSIVHKGQVIAKLDPSLFEAKLQQACANLAKVRADVERSRVQLIDVQQKYARAKELAARSLVPQSELDAAKIAVDAAQATLQSAQAQVTQAEATVNQNQVNLEYTVIAAPIDGIIIQRSVDVGQTVAASMQAPTLFIIAADLTKMQVNANIDEADVGRIRPGQNVTFRVDAYLGEDSQGTVAQIRLQPIVVQNVTTYATIINVPNKDLRLRPGMTANLRVQIARRSNVLRVPNAALRFRPNAEMFAALDQPIHPGAQFAGARGDQGGGAGFGGQRRSNDGLGAAVGSASGAPSGEAPSESAQRMSPGSPGERMGGRDRHARFLERFKTMSRDEQQRMIGRLRDRGQDVSAFEKAASEKAATSTLRQLKYGAPQSAQTIDALFAPLKTVESQGRVWRYVGKQLKPVRLRLGITDGINTELLGDELRERMDLVTGVVVPPSRPALPRGGSSGNPLLPQRRGRPGRGR